MSDVERVFEYDSKWDVPYPIYRQVGFLEHLINAYTPPPISRAYFNLPYCAINEQAVSDNLDKVIALYG